MSKKVILAIVMLALYQNACAKAKSDDIHVEVLKAPDATQCYVIVQNGEARGGNCK